MKLKRSPLAPSVIPELPEVKGVRAATASRGLYEKAGLERDDTMLFAFDEGTHCAGVFTRSSTASDDVEWCRMALQNGQGHARALLVNAGNSNAFTGAFGRQKNGASLDALTRALGVSKDHCFLAATGVIGEPLPRPDYIAELVPEMVSRLSEPDWMACAQAFMTTDTFPKVASAEIAPSPGHHAGCRIVGIAKGSGMIAPNMATMLAYVFTDAALPASALDDLTRAIAERTFNRISVDGDTSTSDSLMVFATGKSDFDTERLARETTGGQSRLPGEELAEAMERVMSDLAEQIVRDGEGATKLIHIHVTGAGSEDDAKTVGTAIGNSPLVKTALAASDANWGRVVMAVGKAGVPVARNRLRIWFGDHLVAENGGRSADYSEEAASAACAGDDVRIRVDLGLGDGEAHFLTCDLTHAYIDINGAYRT